MTRFEDVVYELSRIRDGTSLQESSLIDTARAVLKNYNFTRTSYDRIRNWFDLDPERWEPFVQAVLDRYQRPNHSPPEGTGQS